MDDDRLLVTSCLNGDLKAFERLVDRYRYAIYGLCLSYVKDEAAAEDLAQEAFIVAFLNLRRFAAPFRFGAWLRRLAANLCNDWLQRYRDYDALSEAAQMQIAGDQTSALDEIAARETRQTVQGMINQLTRPQREAVTLFYLQEMSIQQIAEFLDLSEASIKQRLYRARQRLQELVLDQIRDTLVAQRLPDDFTERVLQSVLLRGRQLLAERRWDEAKAEFCKVAASVAHQMEARRGLGLALKGCFQEQIKSAQEPYDEAIFKEALAHLEEAYRLGADDPETAWALADVYPYFSMDRLVCFLEGYSTKTGDSEQAFKAARLAANHAVCFLQDFDKAIALHQRALRVPGIAIEERLLAHLNQAILTAYINAGKGAVWSTQAKALYGRLTPPLGMPHVFYHLENAELARRTGQLRRSIRICRRFIGRLQSEAVADPVARRFWVNDLHSELIKSHYALNQQTALKTVLKEAQGNLQAYQSEWRQAVDTVDATLQDALHQRYKRQYSAALHNLGFACMEVDMVDAAEAFFGAAQQHLETALRCTCLAGLRLRQGDRKGSLEILRYINETYKEYLLSGQVFALFHRLANFAPVRGDAAFLALVGGRDSCGKM